MAYDPLCYNCRNLNCNGECRYLEPEETREDNENVPSTFVPQYKNLSETDEVVSIGIMMTLMFLLMWALVLWGI
jgi:hypothetical protein